MFSIGAAVALVVGIIVLIVVILGKRPVDMEKLGSVSDRWITEHRVDSRWTSSH